jgi:hypothetical protein
MSTEEKGERARRPVNVAVQRWSGAVTGARGQGGFVLQARRFQRRERFEGQESIAGNLASRLEETR